MADGGVTGRAMAYIFSKPDYRTENTKALPGGKGTINRLPQTAGLNNRRTSKGIGRERRPGIAFRVGGSKDRYLRNQGGFDDNQYGWLQKRR